MLAFRAMRHYALQKITLSYYQNFQIIGQMQPNYCDERMCNPSPPQDRQLLSIRQFWAYTRQTANSSLSRKHVDSFCSQQARDKGKLVLL